ncbi:MAG: hypothetical protein UW22_C0004G0035 [Candidatus Gottesmanbacteria bacterium GW2011_GWB1_44_11c]|uniref:Uncharacterized protein n=1 Tax=Candidatus Gottesmanbacteria bacterium GW2011_GWB1_44_11c TaxID=1618447 RepID=A0A0G1GW74_9BACT|nr:MAG: hypothetical protein UW22_C0004G0035 [Candidatus Gottesmanbacteria bacterium GW2011_GWB1_44_11c]
MASELLSNFSFSYTVVSEIGRILWFIASTAHLIAGRLFSLEYGSLNPRRLIESKTNLTMRTKNKSIPLKLRLTV